MSLLPTGPTLMFYEERMHTRCSHKQHDKKRPSGSKFVDFILSFLFSLSVQLSFQYG